MANIGKTHNIGSGFDLEWVNFFIYWMFQINQITHQTNQCKIGCEQTF